MKITIDIPDTSMCAFFNLLYSDNGRSLMQVRSISTKELHDGAKIVVRGVEGK